MIQSLKNLETATEYFGYQPDHPAWESLQEKIMEHVRFWSEIRALSTRRQMDKAHPHWQRAAMKTYLGVNRLSDRDWLFLSQAFSKLVKKSYDCEHLDECVRMVRDFMRLEEGKHIDRQINFSTASNYNFIPTFNKSDLELLEELPDEDADHYMEKGDFDLDHDWCPSPRWLAFQGHLLAEMDDLEQFKSQFPIWTPVSSVLNLISCIRPVVSQMDDFSQGVEEAIDLSISYLKQRRSLG